MSKVKSIPLPPDLRGEEVMRVVLRPEGGTICVLVHSTGLVPPEWGAVLWEVAQRVASDCAKAEMTFDGRTLTYEEILADIAQAFNGVATGATRH